MHAHQAIVILTLHGSGVNCRTTHWPTLNDAIVLLQAACCTWGGAATGDKLLPPRPRWCYVRMRAIAPHNAIKTLLSHAAAVDRRALPGAHRTMPFAANSALRGKGRHLCACTVAVWAGVWASAWVDLLLPAFYSLLCSRCWKGGIVLRQGMAMNIT